MALLAHCRQCGRDVDATRYGGRSGRCMECMSANELLYQYWRSREIAVSRRKPNRQWLVWESGALESE
jgi:hypothetical protein